MTATYICKGPKGCGAVVVAPDARSTTLLDSLLAHIRTSEAHEADDAMRAALVRVKR